MLQIQQVKLTMLKPWQDNPRDNDDAVDAVARSIKSFGFNVPILCDRQFTIIAGHTRWKAAKKLDMDSVPVIVLDVDDVQRRAFAIADNRTAELAAWNYPRLQTILASLKCQRIDLTSLGYAQTQLDMLLAQYREFDWRAFDEQLQKKLMPAYVLIPVKIRADAKESLKTAIQKVAQKHGIRERDFAKMAGQVISFLLELQL
jgi:ParB family chromosome partitioning protein